MSRDLSINRVTILHIFPPSLLSLLFLVTPIPLHEISAISRHPRNQPLGAKKPQRTARSDGVFQLHAQLHVCEAQHEERGHGVGKHFAVAAVEFHDGGEGECQRDVFEEVGVGAGVEVEGVGVGV